MPYVPSKKTDGKSTDREVLDAAVENLAKATAPKIANNLSLIEAYKSAFVKIAQGLQSLARGTDLPSDSTEAAMARAIYDVGAKYGYEGAYLGELNYAMTRFIQRVPQMKVESKEWKEELRYWLYAATVEALVAAAAETLKLGTGVSGVFHDIKDEYKRRVNPAYEAAQIVKSGDCYDTPYYNRLVEIVDESGAHIGHILVDMKRSEETLHKDILDARIVCAVAKLPKMANANGKQMHFSVGAVIKVDGKYLLIDRSMEPLGFAGLAGHINEGETPEETLFRKIKEESGLAIKEHRLLFEEEVGWNLCRAGIKPHYWYLYECEVSGELRNNAEASKSIEWYAPDEIAKLKLEPVWEYWFKKLGVLTK